MKIENRIILENIPEHWVTCKICGKKLKKVSGTHLHKKHNTTSELYLKAYPNAKLITADALRNYSKANKIKAKNHPEIFFNTIVNCSFNKINKKKHLTITKKGHVALRKLCLCPEYKHTWTKKKYYDCRKKEWVFKT